MTSWTGPSSAVVLFLFFNQITSLVVPDPEGQLSSVLAVLTRRVMTEPVWANQECVVWEGSAPVLLLSEYASAGAEFGRF